MNSPVVSPVPRPAEFQAHIYDSFLQGRTSDVALRICGSWDAFYKFHRVVLIQAVCTLSLLLLWSSVRLHLLEEFFRDLFTGGFVESEDKGFSPGSRVASGPIELTLYDPNITRAGTWLSFLFYTVRTNRPTIPVLTCISAFEYVLIGSYRPYFNHPLSFIWSIDYVLPGCMAEVLRSLSIQQSFLLHPILSRHPFQILHTLRPSLQATNRQLRASFCPFSPPPFTFPYHP